MITLNASTASDRLGSGPGRTPEVVRATPASVLQRAPGRARLDRNASDTSRDEGVTRHRGTSLAERSQRYAQWGVVAQAQSRIATFQSAEQALVQAYRQLLQVSRQLEQAASGHKVATAAQLGERLGNEIGRLARQLQQPPSALDSRLTPAVLQAGGARASYQLTRVDLLTPRPQAERLQLLFSGFRQGAEFELPAEATPDQVVAILGRELAPLNIGVARNSQGELTLHVPVTERSRFEAPLLVTGQGIRVPAGNPVPIQLDPEPGVLAQLEAGLRSDPVAQRSRIRQLLASLQEHQRELQQQSAEMTARLRQLRGGMAATGDTLQLGEEVAAMLRRVGFADQVGMLLAQANLSRSTVVALMSR